MTTHTHTVCDLCGTTGDRSCCPACPVADATCDCPTVATAEHPDGYVTDHAPDCTLVHDEPDGYCDAPSSLVPWVQAVQDAERRIMLADALGLPYAPADIALIERELAAATWTVG